MKEILGKYKNGNYDVTIYEDGTKIRENDLDNLTPSFAESCDVTITQKCDGKCKFCYANCTPEGKHADILHAKFLNTLHPYTEMALNGNDLTHPDLEEFLYLLKDKKVISNITVNQRHFIQKYDLLKDWIDKKLIYGLGVSYNSPTVEFLDKIKTIPNSVVHTINGVLTPKDIQFLMNHDLKLLILGYKQKGRGVDWYKENKGEIDFNMEWLKFNLPLLFSFFKVVSFDNLALDQLNVKKYLTEEQWKEFYMGDEAQYTFFIDLIKGTFAKSSLETNDYPMLDNIDDMFNFIRSVA